MTNPNDRPSLWTRVKRAAKSRGMKRALGGADKLLTTYLGSFKWKWIFLLGLLGTGVYFMTTLTWWGWLTGSSTTTVREGQQATKVERDAPLTPSPEVPYGYVDSAGQLQLDEIQPAAPEKLEATVTVGPEGVPVGVDVKDPLFPEFKSPGAQIEARSYGPDSVSVVITPRPRPLLEWKLDPTVGVAVTPNLQGAPLTEPRLYAGVDAVRFGPLHMGGGAMVGSDSLGRVGATPAVTGGVLLKRNVMLTCSRDVGTSTAGTYRCGASITF